MTLGSWLSVLAICLLGAMSPGPSLAVIVRNAVDGGIAHGIATALAHAVGVGLYAVITIAGLGVVLAQRPLLHDALALLGALYLVVLAAARARPAPKAGDVRTGLAHVRAVRQGLIIALLNPKIALFFLALFSQFVDPAMDVAAHGLLAATAMLVDGAWYTLVALAIGRGARLAWLHEHSRWCDSTMRIGLLAVALATLANLYAWRS